MALQCRVLQYRGTVHGCIARGPRPLASPLPITQEERQGGRREGEREERMGGDKVVVGLLGWAVLMGLFFNSGFSGPLFFFSFRSIYDVYDKCIRIYMAPPNKPP